MRWHQRREFVSDKTHGIGLVEEVGVGFDFLLADGYCFGSMFALGAPDKSEDVVGLVAAE